MKQKFYTAEEYSRLEGRAETRRECIDGYGAGMAGDSTQHNTSIYNLFGV